MSNLEYVFSGCGHTRIISKAAYENEDVRNAIVDLFKRNQGLNNHVYSVLFNAHTEKGFGKIINDNYPGAFYKVHSDSGGLQIITQGLDITPEMKTNIYVTQRDNSDIAMSFDEIPVILEGATSNRNDVNNRKFDDANFIDFAKRTGQNVAEQLAVFAEKDDHSCKPLIIIQGNCLDTYCKWAEVIMEQIPDELVDGIGGVSLGAAGLGTGTLEDIERMFALNELPMPDKVKSTLHVLGVGSARRLMPIITFRNNGRLDGVHVSYDSTTHSSGLSLGNYYDYEKQSLIKLRKNNAATIFNHANQLSGMNIDHGLMWDSLHNASKEFAALHAGKDVERYVSLVSVMMSSIVNFTKTINDLETDRRKFNQFIDKRKLTHYHSLQSVKTRADFDHWMSNVGRHIKSARVKKASDVVSTVEDFF